MIQAYETSPEGAIALTRAMDDGLKLFIPPPPLSLSEWADRYAYLPPETSAAPGKFLTAAAEYQREIQDSITEPQNQRIVLMMSAQSGKTQIQINAVGYYSHWQPSPIMVVQYSVDEAELFSKNRIAKTIRVTPVLRDIFPEARTRDSGNTLLNKEFLGGVLTIRGANSPAGLASRPVRILIPDEVDRYPESAGTEGDPIDLAEKRTTTFWNRKIIMASTPGDKGKSRIEEGYKESDQRRYYVPCPHCGEMQILEWGRLKYEFEAADDRDEEGERKYRIKEWYYICREGCLIEERAKFEMIRHGEWRSTARSVDGKTVGFHINALYSPWVEWSELIQEWLKAQGNMMRLKTFINTRLAETWVVKGEGIDRSVLEKRREDYGAGLPSGVLFLTCGVDIQKDRIEASVWGFGLDSERWAIEHEAFFGDPGLPVGHEESPWRKLDEFLNKQYQHNLGPTLRIACSLVDSGNGNHTKRIYEFTESRELRRIYACKGASGSGKPLISTANRVGKNKVLVYGVGTDTAKQSIYGAIRIMQVGPGFVHFPLAECFNAEYFKQLESEQFVQPEDRGEAASARKAGEWIKKYERNESLDCAVYALAAVDILNPNYGAIAANFKAKAERFQELREAEITDGKVQKSVPSKSQLSPLAGLQNAWVDAWRR